MQASVVAVPATPVATKAASPSSSATKPTTPNPKLSPCDHSKQNQEEEEQTYPQWKEAEEPKEVASQCFQGSCEGLPKYATPCLHGNEVVAPAHLSSHRRRLNPALHLLRLRDGMVELGILGYISNTDIRSASSFHGLTSCKGCG